MKKILIYIFIATLLVPITSKAQDTYKLLAPLPCIEGTGNNCITENGARVVKDISLETYIGYIFKFAIAISAFLAVIMIIYGGFEIMLSEAIPAKLDGKERIKNAIFGLLMVLSSYLILRTIDPRLVEIYTTLPPIAKCRTAFEKNCIDTSGAIKFQEDLSRDLNNLSTLKQQAINTAMSDRDKKNLELQMINTRLDDSNVSEEEKVTLRTSKEKLREEIKGLDSTVKVAKAENNGVNSFNTALSLINTSSPSNETRSNLANYTTQTSENEFTKQYEPSIRAAIVSGNTEERVMLEKQRDFFKEQVRIENTQNEILSTINPSKAWLNEKINPTKIQGTGVEPEIYNRVLDARISKLNLILSKK